MFKLLMFSLLSLLIASCSHVSQLRTLDNSVVYKESDPDKIEVYSTANIGKQYLVIGEVLASADAGENSEKPVRLLREEASKLGADAIINLRLSFCEGYWDVGINATGTAVKFK
ncbi:MAG: heavy metal-binding domain-containing protein [FCB group bacterium]|jgi:hypothetical protein